MSLHERDHDLALASEAHLQRARLQLFEFVLTRAGCRDHRVDRTGQLSRLGGVAGKPGRSARKGQVGAVSAPHPNSIELLVAIAAPTTVVTAELDVPCFHEMSEPTG